MPKNNGLLSYKNPTRDFKSIPKKKTIIKYDNKKIDREKVHKYIDSGLYNNEISKIMGCNSRTVDRIVEKCGADRASLTKYKDNRADIMADLQRKIIEHINENDEKIEKASIRDLSVLFGILYDKERIERGKVSNYSINIVASIEDAQKLRMKAWREQGDAQAPVIDA
jgi:patatin-like phospholipase/acyl hydrolase